MICEGQDLNSPASPSFGNRRTLFMAQAYKLLLKSNLESEYVKHCVIQRAKNCGSNIMLEQWDNVWMKGLKMDGAS